MRILRIVLVVVAFLLLAGWGLGTYLLGREAVPESSDFAIDRAELKYMAHAVAGPLPVRLNHQIVAEASLPRAFVLAGASFEPHAMLHGVYQIVYPDGSYLLVDAAFGPDFFEAMPGHGSYDAAAFERVEQALAGARQIVLTHEHADHIQGLAELDDPASVAGRLFMNAAQHANPETAEILPPELMQAVVPVRYAGMKTIAPGVVLLPAPGHTPGSQLVYVRSQDRREYLLVGDVAWHMDAIRELHYRPRLVTDFFLHEDRKAVMAQLRSLHDLLDDQQLQIVVSHDADQRARLVESGALGDGLALPAP